MDKQEYLNTISKQSSPNPPKANHSFLSSKILWVSIIGVVLFIIIIIVGSLLSGSNGSYKDKLFSLILHVNNTREIIDEYQTNVKSSDLRSDSSSLNGILTDASSFLTVYATEQYNFSNKAIKESIEEEETTYKDSVLSDLFEAKITGALDHVYAQKLATDISLIQSTESQLIKSATDSDLEDKLEDNYNSLELLYNKFNNFSESK